jgi:prevent-host-death family protein
MVTEIDATLLDQKLDELLASVRNRGDCVVIGQGGEPVAALVNVRLFRRIRRMEERCGALVQRMEAGFAGVPETEGLAGIEAAIRQERESRIRARGTSG